MISAKRFRALALSQPEVEEKSHFGQPDFRVQKKIFAGLSRDGLRGNLKLTFRLQEQARERSPDAFSPCEGTWGRSGWTYVILAQATYGELKTLMREAWILVAPKSLVAAHTPAPNAPRPASNRRKRGGTNSSSRRRRPA
jgi:hypothetical protein